MRKAIEVRQQNLIECDNCDYIIPNSENSIDVDIKKYLNMPCPKCGANLLTEKDYLDSLKFLKTIKWINKWFSWITIFSSKKKGKTYRAKIHNGLTVVEKK